MGRNKKSPSFLLYISGRVDFFRSIGKEERAKKYGQALDKLRRFTGGKDLTFDDITPDRMMQFSAWCEQQGNCPNTISFYNRILRTLYNQAVDEGITEDTRPFRKSFCGNEKTVKRAIPISRVRTLAHMEFITKGKERRSMEYARDIFMLSFYFRGMSFIDMAFLKKTDIQQGTVIYRRHKTGQRLFIKLEKPMMEIIRRIGGGEASPYVLNIIKREGKERDDVKAANYRINKSLHKIGGLIGVDNLTMYVARHSWASACKASNIPISVISEGMGHDSEETTRIYLAQLDTSVVDKANRKIINQVI